MLGQNDASLRPDLRAFERFDTCERRPRRKTLDQQAKSGDPDVKRHATWGMSVENRGRNGVSRIWKHPQKSGAAKQDGKAQPVMAAPQTSDDVAIKSVQMEIPGELFTRGVSTEAGKPAALIVSQMSCRHIVRNLQHLQRVSGRPKNNNFSFAKDMRENKSFCNMFRTVAGVHL